MTNDPCLPQLAQHHARGVLLSAHPKHCGCETCEPGPAHELDFAVRHNGFGGVS
jgi:hypothetical protein